MELKNIIKAKSKEEIQDLKKRGFRYNSGKWKFNISIVGVLNKYVKNKNLTEFRDSMIKILNSKIDDLSIFVNEPGLKTYKQNIDYLKSLFDPKIEDIQKSMDILIDWADDYDIWIESESEDKDI